MMKTEDNVRVIISAILEGDAEAYGLLVNRYLQGLVCHLTNLIGDNDDAEDIAQEAFIKAYQKLGQYKEQYAFSTWLYRIADNMAFRYIKKSKKVFSIENIIEVLADDNAIPFGEQLDKKTEQTKIRQAVTNLDPRYRQVITLYYWENFNYDEIALILKKPIGTVRTWLSRGKDQLRKELYGTTR